MTGNVDKDNIQVLFVCFQEAFEKFSEVLGLLNSSPFPVLFGLLQLLPRLFLYLLLLSSLLLLLLSNLLVSFLL